MMLAVWVALSPKGRPDDADDAGCVGPYFPKYAQLMLMMLAVWVPVFPKYAQLMLMMQAVWGFVFPKYAQLMLMMLAVWGPIS